MEVSHKKKVLADQRRSMGTHYVGKRVYSTETLTRAFEYFAMSLHIVNLEKIINSLVLQHSHA